MDKLEPILKNHFWILLVPLLSMNLWGYFSANSALKEATKARESVLDTVKGGIAAGTTNPNADYAAELKKKNEVLEKYVNEELLDLWKRQQERMVWPPRVAPDIPKVYLSDIKNNKVRYTYQTDYAEVLRQLHESVEPFVADKRGISWTPKVDFPFQLIPQMKIGNLTITSKQMWDAQEDVWVTQFILNAIRQMNKDADSETSAVVRRVLAYRLLGGEGPSGGEAATPDGSSGGMDSSESMAAAYQGAGNQPVGGFGGQGSQASRFTSAVKFDPVEEFGPGGEAEVGGGGRGNGMTMAMSSSSSQPTGEVDGESTEPTGPLRYVKELPENPYVERGFYLSVIINQNKLVDFMVALSNSEWPVRVVRFHFGKNPYAPDPFSSTRGGGGNLLSMGMRGRGGMSPGGYSANPSSSGSEAFTQPANSSNFTGSMAGGMGAAGNTGYPVDALQHPDLVQLDLAGLITMYRQPPEELAALEAAATGGGATTPEAAPGETPGEGEMPTDPATPAAGETPAEAPAVEPEVPAAEPASPAEPVPAAEAVEKAPETAAPPAETPGEPASEPVPAVPAPAAEPPPATDPANP